MKKILIFILLTLNIQANIQFNEEKAKNILLSIANKSHNKDFIEEANNFKFKLIDNYQAIAREAINKEEYSFMKKICKQYNIPNKKCLNKFIYDIETTKYYEEFRIATLEFDKKTSNREYIEYLYEKYPKYKEYIRVNFDTNIDQKLSLDKNNLRIIDYPYVFLEKKEYWKGIFDYYFYFAVFIFLLMILRDFKLKKTKTKIFPLIFISILTILFLYLQ